MFITNDTWKILLMLKQSLKRWSALTWAISFPRHSSSKKWKRLPCVLTRERACIKSFVPNQKPRHSQQFGRNAWNDIKVVKVCMIDRAVSAVARLCNEKGTCCSALSVIYWSNCCHKYGDTLLSAGTKTSAGVVTDLFLTKHNLILNTTVLS